MRITKKMPSISNVVAGSTATLNVPVGRTIDRLTFALANIAPVDMKNIKVIVDGKTIQEYPSGATLAKLNAFYGFADNSGFLTLHFKRPEMANMAQRGFTGLGTVGVQSLQIMFDIEAAVVDPLIVATAVQSEPQALGSIIKIKRFPMASAVAGQIEIDKIVKGPTIRAVHVLNTDALANTLPSHLEIEMDSIKVFEASYELSKEIQKQYGRVPQDLMYHCDFTLEGDFGQSLVTAKAQDLRIRPTLEAAGSLDVIVEYIDGFKGI